MKSPNVAEGPCLTVLRVVRAMGTGTRPARHAPGGGEAMILCLRCATERQEPMGACPSCKRVTAIVRAESEADQAAWVEAISSANLDNPARQKILISDNTGETNG